MSISFLLTTKVMSFSAAQSEVALADQFQEQHKEIYVTVFKGINPKDEATMFTSNCTRMGKRFSQFS